MTRFERRLYIGFAILVALFTPVVIGSFVVISQLENTQGELLSKNAEDVIEAERLSSLLNQEFAVVESFVLHGHPDTIKALARVHSDFRATARHLLSNRDAGESPELLTEVLKLEEMGYRVVDTAVLLRNKGATIQQLDDFMEKSHMDGSAKVLELVRSEVELQQQQFQDARVSTTKSTRRLVIGLILACAFALLATSAIIILLYQMIRNKGLEDRRRDERLRLELELSTARKEAVEVVAHDLKNPLSSLKMSLELLRDEIGTPLSGTSVSPDAALGLQIATRSIESMQRLIDDQLDHTKIESGQFSLERTIVNVTELLKDCEMRFRPLLEAREISFAAKFDRAMFADIDASRIEQVLSNLLGNALKFTPHGGIVQLLGVRYSSSIVISVKDNGKGISKEAREHIFERYYQVKETAKKGTGLGLSIAKGIAEAHGGELRCISELGNGAQFDLVLKAAELPRPAELSH